MTRELSASVRAKEDRAEWREATFATAWRVSIEEKESEKRYRRGRGAAK